MHVSSVNLATAPARLEIGSRMTSHRDRQAADPRSRRDRPARAERRHDLVEEASRRPRSGGLRLRRGRLRLVVGRARSRARAGNVRREPDRRRPRDGGCDASAIGCDVGGAVVLEVTCGRIPCSTLTARMGIRAFTPALPQGGTPGSLLPRDRDGNRAHGDRRALRARSGPDPRHRRVRRDVLRTKSSRASRSSSHSPHRSTNALGVVSRDQLAALRSP